MATSKTSPSKQYVVFRSFLNEVDYPGAARGLTEEALRCHNVNLAERVNQFDSVDSLTSSLKLETGVSCGDDLSTTLPLAVDVARRAFRMASNGHQLESGTQLTLQSLANGPLSGLLLLYGLNGTMAPHYDSPTTPGQKEEWLVMLSLGNTAHFRCNDTVVPMYSGDVIVMDSMAVLHGVESIQIDTHDETTSSILGLPSAQARLGILFWKGHEPVDGGYTSSEEETVEGIHLLFGANDN